MVSFPCGWPVTPAAAPKPGWHLVAFLDQLLSIFPGDRLPFGVQELVWAAVLDDLEGPAHDLAGTSAKGLVVVFALVDI